MKSDTTPAPKKPAGRDSLATGFERLPEMLKEHSNKILLLASLGLLAFAAWRYRSNQAVADRVNTSQQLAVAWDSVTRLEQLPADGRLPQDVVASSRLTLFNAANETLDGVLASADTAPARSADAWLARGRLFWAMANLPTLPGAATQPALNPPKPADFYLTSAQAAFEKIVSDFPEQTTALTQARFALAAVYENRGDFDKAAEAYKQISTTEKILPVDKRLAEDRLDRLDLIRKPILLIPPPVAAQKIPDFLTPNPGQSFSLDPSQPQTRPASQPAASQLAASQPAASQPTTRP